MYTIQCMYVCMCCIHVYMYTMYTWCVIFLAWDSLVVVGCLICRLQYQECHVWIFVLQANLRLVKSNTTTWIVNTFCCNLTSSHEIKRFSEKWEKGRLDFWKSMTCLFLYFRWVTHIFFAAQDEKYLLVLSQDYEECPCIYFLRGHSRNVPSLFFNSRNFNYSYTSVKYVCGKTQKHVCWLYNNKIIKRFCFGILVLCFHSMQRSGFAYLLSYCLMCFISALPCWFHCLSKVF